MAAPSIRIKRSRNQVPRWVVVLAFVALLPLLGWLAQINFNAVPEPPPMDARQRSHRNLIREIVERTGGDYRKTTAKDRAAIKKITGPQWIKAAYEEVRDNPDRR